MQQCMLDTWSNTVTNAAPAAAPATTPAALTPRKLSTVYVTPTVVVTLEPAKQAASAFAATGTWTLDWSTVGQSGGPLLTAPKPTGGVSRTAPKVGSSATGGGDDSLEKASQTRNLTAGATVVPTVDITNDSFGMGDRIWTVVVAAVVIALMASAVGLW